MRTLLLVLFIGPWLPTLLAGCNEQPAAPAAQQSRARDPIPVAVAAVTIQPAQRTVEVVGTLWGDEDATISAKVSGRILSIHVDVGDRVDAGQVLAQIDPTDYQLLVTQRELAVREILAKLGLREFPPADFDPGTVPTVQRARLQAENAEAKHRRGRQLHEQDPPLISDQDYADLQTLAEVAQKNYSVERLNAEALLAQASASRAELDLARQRLLDTTIRSPQTARSTVSLASISSESPATQPTDHSYAVAARLVSFGEYVKEGTPLFRLVDDDPIKLRAMAPEKHVAEIAVGQTVRVRIEAYPDEFIGTISRANPQIDPLSRTFQFEVLIPNPEHRLKPGGFARGSVNTRVDPKAVFVPRQALVTFAGVNKVFAVKADKAVEILVEPGDRAGDLVEIRKGLAGSETIVVAGANRLANGAPVVVKDTVSE